MARHLAIKPEDIFAVCDQYYEQEGQFPSTPKLRQLLDTSASQTTLTRFLNQWKTQKREQQQQSTLAVSEEMPISRKLQFFGEEIDRHLEEQKAERQQLLEENEQFQQEAEAETSKLFQENLELKAKLELFEQLLDKKLDRITQALDQKFHSTEMQRLELVNQVISLSDQVEQLSAETIALREENRALAEQLNQQPLQPLPESVASIPEEKLKEEPFTLQEQKILKSKLNDLDVDTTEKLVNFLSQLYNQGLSFKEISERMAEAPFFLVRPNGKLHAPNTISIFMREYDLI